MPTQPGVNSLSSYYVEVAQFDATQLPISQTNTVLKVVATAAASGALANTLLVMARPGFLMGMTVSLSGPVTTSTLSVTPNFTPAGGSLTPATGLTVLFSGSGTYKYAVTDCNSLNAFNAGDTIGVRYTTSGTFAPTTLDMIVRLEILHTGLQA